MSGAHSSDDNQRFIIIPEFTAKVLETVFQASLIRMNRTSPKSTSRAIVAVFNADRFTKNLFAQFLNHRGSVIWLLISHSMNRLDT